MYAIIDIETTGGSYKDSKIIEIAILHFNGYEVTDKFVTLINPQRPIPWFIKNLTHIDDSMVKDAPLFEEVADKILSYTQNRIFVAHNINFDYNFVKHEFATLGISFDRKKLCTVQLSRKIIPHLPSYSLGNLCQSLGIHIDEAVRHRAEGDAQATAELTKQLLWLSQKRQIKIW